MPIENIIDHLGKLYGAPGYVLVVVFCVICGYCIKRSRFIDNSAIPLGVVLVGIVVNMLIADPKADALPLRIWLVKNAIIGAACGIVAWLLHNRLLKKFLKDDSEVDTTIIKKQTTPP